jgi:ActR/RegA family two-component response regulator
MHELKTSGGRILFADDDKLFRDGLATVLFRRGFECHCASSASGALDLLDTFEFDALLADIHMPGNHNLELIQEVSKTAPGLPSILLTGLPAVETAVRSVRLPVVGYLVKPPDIGELTSLLGHTVRDQQSRRALQACRLRLKQWDAELQEIESQYKKRSAHGCGDSEASFVSLTLRNLILTLVDFERSVATLSHQAAPAALHQSELASALRRAVAVLEKTKQNFKSKDLGELRQDLERLLGNGK